MESCSYQTLADYDEEFITKMTIKIKKISNTEVQKNVMSKVIKILKIIYSIVAIISMLTKTYSY